jgi:hypothetical protein
MVTVSRWRAGTRFASDSTDEPRRAGGWFPPPARGAHRNGQGRRQLRSPGVATPRPTTEKQHVPTAGQMVRGQHRVWIPARLIDAAPATRHARQPVLIGPTEERRAPMTTRSTPPRGPTADDRVRRDRVPALVQSGPARHARGARCRRRAARAVRHRRAVHRDRRRAAQRRRGESASWPRYGQAPVGCPNLREAISSQWEIPPRSPASL